jgi:hypothetical protein
LKSGNCGIAPKDAGLKAKDFGAKSVDSLFKPKDGGTTAKDFEARSVAVALIRLPNGLF